MTRMPARDRRLTILAAFTGLYLVIGMALALRWWNYEFVFYGGAMVVEIACVVWLHRRARLPLGVLWALSVWGLLHFLGGTAPIPDALTEPGRPRVLYNLRVHPDLPKFDQMVHAYGFFAATLAGWHGLRAAAPGLRPTLGPLLAATLIGMGLGAMNEVLEFVATRIMPGTNVGGYENTGWDLVANLVGCVAAACLVRARSPRVGARSGA